MRTGHHRHHSFTGSLGVEANSTRANAHKVNGIQLVYYYYHRAMLIILTRVRMEEEKIQGLSGWLIG